MAFANKTNGREYINKSNNNPIKVQTMNYRNSLTNSQYCNSSNGESYSYEEKTQRNCNSPKGVLENHGLTQHNTSSRESYSYKGNNLRSKPYHQNKNFGDRHNNYYNQRPESPDEFLVPEIERLREFISDQTERFKNELLRHENNKSSYPSPSGHHFDQSNYKYNNKSQGSVSRQGNGLTVSHSLSSIANNSTNGQTIQTLTVSPSCIDNSNRHPDARMNQGPIVVIKNNSSTYKHYLTVNNSKPSPGITRNLSYDETFSKTPSVVVNNKNRNDSPNNTIDKSGNNKLQFPSPTGSSGGRHDAKKVYTKTKSHTFQSGANTPVYQNNSVQTMIMTNEVNKSDQQQQQGRTIINVTHRNEYTNGSSKLGNRRRLDNRDCDVVPNSRAVVSVAESSARRVSHSGSSTTDSQDVGHSIADTPTAPDQFFTPDPSESPCSTRSSPDTASTTFQYQRSQRKPGPVVNTRIVSSNNHE